MAVADLGLLAADTFTLPLLSFFACGAVFWAAPGTVLDLPPPGFDAALMLTLPDADGFWAAKEPDF